jgi:hypothetical protein
MAYHHAATWPREVTFFADGPDRAAIQALHDAYARMTCERLHRGARPWSQKEMLTLGRLYVAAWRVLPTPSRLKAQWSMPDRASVVRMFGSFAGYYAQISKEPAA